MSIQSRSEPWRSLDAADLRRVLKEQWVDSTFIPDVVVGYRHAGPAERPSPDPRARDAMAPVSNP